MEKIVYEKTSWKPFKEEIWHNHLKRMQEEYRIQEKRKKIWEDRCKQLNKKGIKEIEELKANKEIANKKRLRTFLIKRHKLND